MNPNTNINSALSNRRRSGLLPALSAVACSCLLLLCAPSRTRSQTQTESQAKQKTFATAEEAADALIAAAEQFNEAALKEIIGPESYDIVHHTGEPARGHGGAG